MALPLTSDPTRRRPVLLALLKMAEAGFLGRMAEREWAPRYPSNPRETPGFRCDSR